MSLPRQLLTFGGGDKDFREKWVPNRDLLNFPKSYRMILVGRPNSGKSTVVLNVLLRAKPQFDEIFLLHCDKYSKDYEDVDTIKLDGIPDVKTFSSKGCKCLIIDDYPFADMNKEDKKKFSVLFRYISSHKNVSILLTSQNLYSIPIIARRTANIFIIWRSPDLSYVNTMSQRCGIRPDKFLKLLDEYLLNFYDSLWVDCTLGTRAPVRINGYEVIDPKSI